MSAESCEHCHRVIGQREPVFLIENQSRIVCRECHDDLQPLCPYCQARLGKRPKYATECTACGSCIQVRSEQHVFQSTILTADQAWEWDTVGTLEPYGATPDDLFRALDQDGERTAKDVVTHLYESALERADKLTTKHSVYWLMAQSFCYQGYDPIPARRNAEHIKLQEFERTGVVEKVKILPAEDACDACLHQGGRVFTLAEAMRLMPLPCRECTTKIRDDLPHSWCRCIYISARR